MAIVGRRSNDSPVIGSFTAIQPSRRIVRNGLKPVIRRAHYECQLWAVSTIDRWAEILARAIAIFVRYRLFMLRKPSRSAARLSPDTSNQRLNRTSARRRRRRSNCRGR